VPDFGLEQIEEVLKLDLIISRDVLIDPIFGLLHKRGPEVGLFSALVTLTLQ
jgi:hypothetical protein